MISLITKQYLLENFGQSNVDLIAQEVIEMAKELNKQCSTDIALDLFVECKNDGHFLNSAHMQHIILSNLRDIE